VRRRLIAQPGGEAAALLLYSVVTDLRRRSARSEIGHEAKIVGEGNMAKAYRQQTSAAKNGITASAISRRRSGMAAWRHLGISAANICKRHQSRKIDNGGDIRRRRRNNQRRRRLVRRRTGGSSGIGESKAKISKTAAYRRRRQSA
jgi:hypothetical protein